MAVSTGATLHPEPEPRKRGLRGSRKLGRLGTTATRAESLAKAEARWFDREPSSEAREWSADLEYVWRSRMAPRVARWQARGAALRRAAAGEPRDAARARLGDLAAYAERRAEGLAMERADRLGSCRKRWAAFGCACSRWERPVGCDLPLLCAWCRRRFYRRHRRRLVRALGVHVRAARAAWAAAGRPPGEERRLTLVTLTARHSGMLDRDREELGAAWRRWHKRLHRRLGSFRYAAAWEWTPGTAGDGHVHLHVVVLWPFVPWAWLHDTWREACPTSSHVHLSSSSAARATTPEKAARYLATYASKGVDMSGFTGGKAGELLVAQYQRRKVTASRGFFAPLHDAQSCCRRCRAAYRLVQRPPSMMSESPLGVWFALATLAGLRYPRGALQRPLPGCGG